MASGGAEVMSNAGSDWAACCATTIGPRLEPFRSCDSPPPSWFQLIQSVDPIRSRQWGRGSASVRNQIRVGTANRRTPNASRHRGARNSEFLFSRNGDPDGNARFRPLSRSRGRRLTFRASPSWQSNCLVHRGGVIGAGTRVAPRLDPPAPGTVRFGPVRGWRQRRKT